MTYDSTADTLDHIAKVSARLEQVIELLWGRAKMHDQSKLEEPEKPAYDLLKQLIEGKAYGTLEYTAVMNDPRIKDAIQHHVTTNSHHPDAHEGGVNGMTLLDVIEMACDWKAASERGGGVSFIAGVRKNRERGVISDQLAAILENTAKELGW